MIRAAIWVRVSTGHQDNENQVPDLERFAEHHGYTIVKRYQLEESAWNGGAKGYKATLEQALHDAHLGQFEVLLVWAVDRLSRGGIDEVFGLFKQFRQRNVTLVSVQEQWLNSNPETQELLLAITSWIAQRESARRSERIKAGLARRQAAGKPVGRQPGAKDHQKRHRSGYVARWERQREQA
ncbi:MAG: recombinase family protein [Chloroflexi bacterium]|nr:recombinase family protein [Chloroflexota bacterium]